MRVEAEHHELRPVREPSLEILETEDGLIVFDARADRVHHLNQTASIILQFCDGSHDLEAIAKELGLVFDLPDPPITETRTCVDALQRERLVTLT